MNRVYIVYRKYKKKILLLILLVGLANICYGCIEFKFNIKRIRNGENNENYINQENVIEYSEDKLLPLGTVISLKDTNKKMMIIGRYRKLEGDSTNKIWDYSGCEYPRVIMSDDDSYFFDADGIGKVYFKGYEDEEEVSYRKRMGKAEDGNEQITNNGENISYDVDKLLPLGSIVTFEGSNKKFVIVGRLSRLKGDEVNHLYDYIGCIYPEGSIDSNSNHLFDGNIITKIYFKGYEDEEELDYNKKLIEYRSSITQ